MDRYKYIDSEDYYSMGLEWKKRKDFERAQEHLSEAISLNPNFIYAYIDLAAVYAEQKNFKDAIHTLNKAIKRDPDFDLLYYTIAKYAYRQQNYGKAIRFAVKAAEINPKKLYLRALALFNKKFRENR